MGDACAAGHGIATVVPLRDRPASLPRVARWLHAAWWHRAGVSRRGAEVLLQARIALDASLPLTLIACLGTRAVGTVSLHAGRVRDTVELSGLYVLPRWRCRGIGAALCRSVEAEARRRGAGTIELKTENAAAYYADIGWQHAGIGEVSFAGRPAPVTCMRRGLEPAEMGAC